MDNCLARRIAAVMGVACVALVAGCSGGVEKFRLLLDPVVAKVTEKAKAAAAAAGQAPAAVAELSKALRADLAGLGADLKGLGPVPPLAGRSPSYTVRQLFDMQQGVRKGPWSALMNAAVEKLTIDDMIAIAAFTASREP